MERMPEQAGASRTRKPAAGDTLISVCAVLTSDPGRNEQFLAETSGILSERFHYHELLLIDNASEPGVTLGVKAWLRQAPNVRLVRLSRKYSHEIALAAALDHSIGDYVVVMDIGSDPPSMIPDLVTAAMSGNDAVIAERLGLPAAADGAAKPGGEPHGEGAAADGRAAGGASPRAIATGTRPAVRYRADDFSISRQRSWGTPIPIVYCESCGTVPLPAEQLPVLLPLDITPTGTGNPLAELDEFVHTTCPRCGGAAQRETDTLDCHFDALWLWLPACVPAHARTGSLPEILALPDLRHWLPCERVVAGSDSGNFVFDQRTVTKALRDIGPLAFLADGEPFAGCTFHEMVIADGRKMSKHLGNVVDPDELVERFGADTLRLAVLYAASPQRTLNWSDSAVLRCHRFLTQVWGYCQRWARAGDVADARDGASGGAGAGETGEVDESRRDTTEHLRRRLEKWSRAAVEKVTEDIEALEMHSAVRNVMRMFERIRDFEKRVLARQDALRPADREALLEALALLLAMLGPLAPHLAEELWIALGNEHGEAQTPWPVVSLQVPA